MSGLGKQIGIFAGLAVLFYIIENVLHLGGQGSLLFNMLFFVALAEGPLAIVAAADIVGGKWIKPYRKELLGTYPFILLVGFLFLVFIPRIADYPWQDHPTAWLNTPFFVARHVVMFLITFFVAMKYARASMSDAPSRNTWAVLYVFSYVISQTLIAFDWVMGLDYPWLSTLFGAYFFVEAFYLALAFGGIITFLRYDQFVEEFGSEFKHAHMDMATLMFGFSIFWAYQFFSQYLVIWYGNIPEEVLYLAERIAHSPTREFAYSVLVILFLIPFVTLLFRKIKGSKFGYGIIALFVFIGIIIERLVMIAPKFSVNPLILVVEFLLILAVFVYVYKQRESYLT